MIAVNKEPLMLGYELLSSYPDIFHFVTTREGGCSVGNYSSLNCSPFSGDNPGRVKRNLENLIDLFPQRPKELLIPFQIHETKIGIVDSNFVHLSDENREMLLHAVDALITNQPGYCVSITTADCVPILLYDPVKKVVAAVHAGWRGTVSRIVVQVILEMGRVFESKPEDILACIGPSISVDNFEVGEDVWKEFSKEGFNMSSVSIKQKDKDKWHIDLWKINELQLTSMGILSHNIEIAGICTYDNHEQFFSARRLGINSGRMLSGIMLQDV